MLPLSQTLLEVMFCGLGIFFYFDFITVRYLYRYNCTQETQMRIKIEGMLTKLGTLTLTAITIWLLG